MVSGPRSIDVRGGVGTKLRREDAQAGPFDPVPRRCAVVERRAQVRRPLLRARLLDVHPGCQRGDPVTDAEDEVGDGDAVPLPQIAQDRGQQVLVLSGPLTVDRVVRRHDRGDTLVGGPFEVGQVDVVQRRLVGLHIDHRSSVLHAVQREVLRACHHVALGTSDQRRAEFTEMVGVVAVRLLCPTPRGMAQEVDAHTPEEVATLRTDLAPDHVADLLLQLDIPRGTARHRHGERCPMTGDAAARPVHEAGAGDPEPIHRTVHVRPAVVALAPHLRQSLPPRCVAVEQSDSLVAGELGVQLRRLEAHIGSLLHPLHRVGKAFSIGRRRADRHRCVPPLAGAFVTSKLVASCAVESPPTQTSKVDVSVTQSRAAAFQ